MENYLTTSLKSTTTAFYLMVMLCISSASLLGQSVTIDSPNAGADVTYCDLEATQVTFMATANDGTGNTTAVLWSWSGPNGFASTDPNPMETFNSSTQSGTYEVEVTFFGGTTATDQIEITVTDGITFECPEDPIRVFDADCMPNLLENIAVSGLGCGGTYTYDLTLDPGTAGEQLSTGNALTEAAGIELDYDFVIPGDLGAHEVLVQVRLNGAAAASCVVDIEVVEGSSNVACNDAINVTMDEDCQAVISPDMVLEGDFCYDAFMLEIDGVTPGNTVTLDEPGTYVVTVSSNSGNCWGTIVAEDKTVPQIVCPTQPVAVRCSVADQIAPGSGITDQRVLDGAIGTVPANDTLRIMYDFSGNDGRISAIELDFLATIDSVQNLAIYLVTPDPDNNNGSTSTADRTMINIADLSTVVTPCPFSNLDVSFRDFAINPYAALGDSLLNCRSANNFAHLGAYRPSTAFSSLNGTQVAFDSDVDGDDDDMNGTWILMVVNRGSTPITDVTSTLRFTFESDDPILGGSEFAEVTGCGNNITFSFSDEQMSSDCTDDFSEIIMRTWTVTNEDSGFSNSCTQQINIRRWNLNEIIFPENHDGLAFAALPCQALVNNPGQVGEDNIPLPGLTGMPRVPFGDLCENLRFTFEDEKIEVCGEYGMKVLRTWTALDWCNSEIREHTQVIKVDQRSPIQTTCPPFEAVFVTGSRCTAEAELVKPIAAPGPNSCASNITYTVGYLFDDDDDAQTVPPSSDEDFERNLNIFDDNGDGLPDRITNLPIGRTWVRYFFEDECGNTGQITKEIDVFDETQPNPICIEFTVIALDEFGCATLPALSIDNNSFDNCGTIVSYEIDDPQLPGGFAPTLEYCCTSDCVDGIRTVNLRVTDDSGNSNTCEVEVEIQNNFNAVIVNRPITSREFDCAQGSVDLFSFLQGMEDQFEITSNCNNSYTFDLTFANGQPVLPGDIFEPGTCGGGNTSVKWEITDRCGRLVGTHNLSLSFSQNLNGFNVSRWPNDVTLNNCTVVPDPENLPSSQNADNIRFTTSNCNSDVAITFSDQLFPDVDDACFKILRTWTVIDWCIVNNSTIDAGRRTHVQVIRVNDSTAPVITNQNNIVVPADGNTCSFFLTEAEFPIDLVVTDNCTAPEDLIISLDIDGVPATSLFNRTYTGTTGVTITAMDNCGNVNTGFFQIVVRDEIPPTPYCRSSVTTTVTPGGFAEIWTSDYDLGGTDNCDTNGLDVTFQNGSTFMRFDCNEIINGVSQIFTTEVIYRDDAGNTNSCSVQVHVQDNEDYCPDMTGGSLVSGNIHTESFQMVEDVMVELMNGNVMQTQMPTEEDGDYAFGDLAAAAYQVVPHKDDSFINGVSTLDLVMIQRHILDVERFNSPYKAIAADADNSGSVNGIDLVTLRKLILGIITELPFDQKPWRFPTEDQQFADVNKPFPFTEVVSAELNGENQQTGQNFVAVKVGDVNADAMVNFKQQQTVDNRSGQTLHLEVEDKGLVQGTIADIDIKSTNMEDIAGFQTTFSFNSDVLQFAGITADGLEVSESNVGLTNVDQGYITLSWNNLDGVTVEAFRTLFTLHFEVLESANVSEQLFLSSVMTKSEAYTGDFETINLSMDYKGVDLTDFVLHQNIPNPFSDNTEVRFSLPEASTVTFTVFDVNGRVLLRNASDYEGGSHTILLTKDELASTGVMYYQIETVFGTASRKMIQIR